jgi:acyl carrier protein
MNSKPVEAIYSLSPQQKGMLFETLFGGESGIFIEQEVSTWKGPVNVMAFQRAWQQIVDRHSVLRTAFVWKEQDEPLQVVLRQVRLLIEEGDWRNLPPAEQQARLAGHLAEVRRRGFDLTQPPLMRLALFRLKDTLYQFAWSQHHILMDGWCRPLILKEFESLYRSYSLGQEPQLEPPHPYREYIAWLAQKELAAAENFWREKLRGVTSPTPLGRVAEDARPAGQTERYESLEGRLGAAETQKLNGLARQHRLTLNTLIQGAWALLLSRYSGEEEVVFGTTVSGRPASLPGAETMIGLFINTLPFRLTVHPATGLWPWLQELQAQHLECREYEYCSTGQIHQWSELPGAFPLYESLLVFQNYPSGSPPPGGPVQPGDASEWQGIGSHTSYTLTVLAAAREELHLRFVYDNRRLEREGVIRIQAQLLSLLRSIAEAPEQRLERLLAQIPEGDIPRFYPARQFGGEERQFVTPRSPAEELLAEIWRELLGVDRISVQDNFFALGGHSLLAMQLISRIRDTFEIEFPFRYLFEAPKLEDLALVIEEILISEIEALSDDEVRRLAQEGG